MAVRRDTVTDDMVTDDRDPGDMALDNVDLDIDGIAGDGERAIAGASTTEALSEVETEFLGKRSALTRAHRTLGGLDPEARREAGRRLNEVRARLEGRLAARRAELAESERADALRADRLDLTEVIPGRVLSPPARGHLHLVTQARDELEDLFVGMGFTVAEGPEAETDWYNFEALNMPPAHPARDTFDTMYLDLGEPETVLLRTHTSPVQIHLMEAAVLDDSLPIHAVMPGKCFRLDTPDASHLPVFNQIEGLVVDRGITFGDLAGTIQAFTQVYFGPGMQSRLRPAYFPFTEPSAEFDITCTVCLGEGCRTCSHTGWIELGGCGMVDPAVFAAVGIDADVWSGFAFGFGIDRLAQMRHAIPDMRSFVENDIRFLSQF
jgi:phenylalanyl-tRNA synthetase alpha chain